MEIKTGLVGLPNVGKSTLFNALTKSSIPAENYPFCTIDPHVAITEVPDARLEPLQKIYTSKKIIPATATFVDIAGLVKGAASGEGLGNQFLSHIREVDLILHVLRCFEDDDILHQSIDIDPISDFETIIAELMLKDLESIEKRLIKIDHLIKAAQNKPPEKAALEEEKSYLTAMKNAIDQGDSKQITTVQKRTKVASIPLLSTKNFLIIANIAEQELEDNGYEQNKHYQALVQRFGKDRVIPISAKVEGELALLEEEDAQEMMAMLGIAERSIDTIIKKSYEHLGLITFFTCGPQEIHAWPITNGTTVRQAGGEIHSDLERGFICADVFNYQDLITAQTVAKVKEIGKHRTEGQDYIVKDGDIIHIKFNV